MQIIRNSPQKKKNKQRNQQPILQTQHSEPCPPTIEIVEIRKDICTDCIVGAEIHDTSCTICLSQYTIGETITTTNCNHIFHKTCLETWIVKNRTCPICRTELKFGNNDFVILPEKTQFAEIGHEYVISANATNFTYMPNYNVLRILRGISPLAYR